ncbi:hypothetical protein [Pediococcus pentosaceus]|uniref:hypothetical protein n=1 Tax=Pediococcus pentosaceus TaxID=1255 RepID=UPI00263BAC24|nr:hypothetical protein [Pediococcus pentosaceus]MDN4853766.1 hypothetical protein [Pediococcus pentosaceus]
MEGKRGSECLLKSVSNIDFNPISYETTPLYKGNEKIPRGSVVDIKSSDGSLNKEIVVINSVEGTKIKYLTGTVISTLKSTKSSQSSESSTKENSEVQSSIKSSEAPSTSSEDTPTAPTSDAGGWTTAPAGKVFVSNSEKYYTRVKNPGNYELTTQSDAQAEGATQAIRGNQYAQP